MSKKNLYAFIISFLLLIAVVILNRLSFRDMRVFSEQVDHTRQVITQLESISNHFKSAQIYSPSSQNEFYDLFKQEADSVGKELIELRKLVADNPPQRKLADSISSMITREMPVLMRKNIAEIVQSGELFRLDHYLAVHEMISRGIKMEERLLGERKSKLNESRRWNNMITTAFAVVAVGILLFTFFSIFFLSRRRRWLEGLLESILDASENGIVHYKAIRKNGEIVDFRLEFINKAIDKLLNIPSAEVTGKKLSELSSFVMETDLFKKYTQVIDTGKPAEFEIFYKRNNVERWLLVSLVKLGDGLTASFHNISQLKKYEEELKDNIRDLERSNTELEQYAYVASHDLQEPLRKIRSFGSYLQDTQAQKLDKKGQQQLDKIMTAAERMSALIKDILSFSSMKRIDAYVSTDLNAIVNTVLQDLDLLISQKNAIVETEELPTIEAIPLQMNQLFYNLINNSLKFSKEGEPPYIRISCRRLPLNEQPASANDPVLSYEIRVQDRGIGFSQEYADQVFGLFKRLNDRTSYPGSGIGLALCKKVVENHHGTIRAESNENEGASFVICLPSRQVH